MESIPVSDSSLSGHFASYFRIILADKPELLEQSYRVRYDVYCREFHYEHEDQHHDRLEYDSYDAYSLHCLILHKASNTPAGCVRLIKLPRDNLSLQLPVEAFCASSLYQYAVHPAQLPRSSLCEISRLAVHTSFRRRLGETESPLGAGYSALNAATLELERRTFPMISIALIAAATALMVLSERYYLFVMVEKWLTRLLKRLGLEFVQIGEFIDYHGPRAAHYLTAEQMLQGMKGDLKEIYAFVYESLAAEIAKADIDPKF